MVGIPANADGLASHTEGSSNTPSRFLLQKLELSDALAHISVSGLPHLRTLLLLPEGVPAYVRPGGEGDFDIKVAGVIVVSFRD